MDEQFPSLTPYIIVRNAQQAIDFYAKALGAEARSVSKMPNGDKIMNAQLQIGDSVLMLNDEFPEWGALGPSADSNLPVTLHINSKDVDADFRRAVDAGMEVTMPLENMFWGDRYGQLKCPFGYKWSMGQKVADLSQEEVDEAAKAMFTDQ